MLGRESPLFGFAPTKSLLTYTRAKQKCPTVDAEVISKITFNTHDFKPNVHTQAQSIPFSEPMFHNEPNNA